jgi:hypothetical protein
MSSFEGRSEELGHNVAKVGAHGIVFVPRKDRPHDRDGVFIPNMWKQCVQQFAMNEDDRIFADQLVRHSQATVQHPHGRCCIHDAFIQFSENFVEHFTNTDGRPASVDYGPFFDADRVIILAPIKQDKVLVDRWNRTFALRQSASHDQ